MQKFTFEFLEKTPKELENEWEEIFPDMSVRLKNILINQFENTPICDITREVFLKTRTAGIRSWYEFNSIIPNNENEIEKKCIDFLSWVQNYYTPIEESGVADGFVREVKLMKRKYTDQKFTYKQIWYHYSKAKNNKK